MLTVLKSECNNLNNINMVFDNEDAKQLNKKVNKLN
jgi:acetolactate synthase small subunit